MYTYIYNMYIHVYIYRQENVHLEDISYMMRRNCYSCLVN